MARSLAPRAFAYSDGIVAAPRLTFVVDGPGGDQGVVETPASPEGVRHGGALSAGVGAGCPRGPSPGMVTDSDGKTGGAPGQADWKKAVESVIAGSGPRGALEGGKTPSA